MQEGKSHLDQTTRSSSSSSPMITSSRPIPPSTLNLHTISHSSTAASPGEQFIFSKPIYNQHYHDTHYHHLERHDSLLHDIKHMFKRNPSTRTNSPTAATTSSNSSISEYSFGNEFNKDIAHRYGKWGAFIGKGAGGSVRVIRRSDKKIFAVKVFNKRRSDEQERDYVKRVTAEFCIGSTLHHDNVIETLDIIQKGSTFYEIMEYAPTDLFSVVMGTDMAFEAITCCWRQLLNGVAYLQDMGLAHRDLKLENLVMDKHHTVKIIDFGTATVVRYAFDKTERLSSGICGSDPYIAPEQYKGKYNGFKADLWSCGIIFVSMILRRFAWRIPRASLDKNYQLYLLNRNSLLAYIPRVARPTMASLLDPKPERRCSMATLLSDPWVESIDYSSCTTSHYHPPLPSPSSASILSSSKSFL